MSTDESLTISSLANPGPVADADHLSEAVALAATNVGAGGGPFAAVVVRDDEVVARGTNGVTRDNDPTAHAEIVAIRGACRALGTFSLAGSTLYTSCEPCPLCVSASLWARLDRVVFAADRHDAARGGFDDREFYELFASDPAGWPTRVEPLALATRAEPFDAWLAKTDRIRY